MGKFMYKGRCYSGSTNYASAVNCLDKDGNESTVQNEIDVLNTQISEQNGNFANKIQWWIDNKYLPDPNNPFVYLYDKGTVYDVYGGLETRVDEGTTTNATTGNITLNESCIDVSSSKANVKCVLTTKNLVDVSRYSKICMKCKILAANTDAYDTIGIALGNSKFYTGDEIARVTTTEKGQAVILELDISTFTGMYYLNFYSYYVAGGQIYEIWLEP